MWFHAVPLDNPLSTDEVLKDRVPEVNSKTCRPVASFSRTRMAQGFIQSEAVVVRTFEGQLKTMALGCRDRQGWRNPLDVRRPSRHPVGR